MTWPRVRFSSITMMMCRTAGAAAGVWPHSGTRPAGAGQVTTVTAATATVAAARAIAPADFMTLPALSGAVSWRARYQRRADQHGLPPAGGAGARRPRPGPRRRGRRPLPRAAARGFRRVDPAVPAGSVTARQG